jgi:MOSC domain-containing protein YiiM
VIVPGEIKAGDRIEVIRRPRHTVTIGRSFRALTTETDLLPSLLEAGSRTHVRTVDGSSAGTAGAPGLGAGAAAG